MSTIRIYLFLLAAFCMGSAQAEKRIALVIGNSAYKSVPRLTNPVNDAALVGGMFEKAGFDLVDVKLDLDAAGMRKALRDFGGAARDAEVAVIYYAGHGLELDGTNYLIPVDATLETDSDILDQTVPLDRVLFAVEPAKQLRLIILDACRDNRFTRTMRRTIATRAVGRGLARVEPTSPNTMIAFAAKAGSTASDGDSKNSPFAAALVARLPTPGLDLRKAFGFVRDDVLKNTGYKQEPYVYGSLGGDDVPLVPIKPVAAEPQADPQDAIRRDYELALQLGSRDVWTAFLAQHPDGFYASLAREQLSRISAEEARIAAEKAKQVEDAKAAAAEQRRKESEAATAKAAAELAARQAADQQTSAAPDQKVAAVVPAASPPAIPPLETTKLLQSELRRAGCMTSAADGDWNASSQRSLALFNKYAGTRFDASFASVDALDAIKARPGRVCPLICDRGFKADGESCVKITCRAGYRVNDDNDCERVQDRKPVATRDSARRDAARKDAERSPPRPEARSSGQLFCNTAGCHPIRPGCHIESGGSSTTGSWGQREACP